MVMKKLHVIFVLAYWALAANAQYVQPYWVTKPPQAGEDAKYYYRVTSAEGKDYEKAYVKAFAMAILESSWKMGVPVNTKDDLATIEQGLTENINVAPSSMTIPINKVCEYREKVAENRNDRLYVLWQVARYGNTPPDFDDFNDCE